MPNRPHPRRVTTEATQGGGPSPRREAHTVLLAQTGALVALALLWPETFQRAMQEDGFVEWGTFWTYVAAAVLAAAALLRTAADGREPPAARLPKVVVYGGLSLFFLFVAGEEISWGQRLIGFSPPEAFLEGNYQQELELHNLLLGRALTDHGPTAVAVLYGMVLPWFAWLFRGRPAAGASRRGLWAWRLARWSRLVRPSVTLVPWFVLVAALYEWYPVQMGGEAIELLLGAVFLADLCLRLHEIVGTPTRWLPPAPVTLAAVVVSLSVATPMLADAVHGSRARPSVEQASAELDRLGDDLAAPYVIQDRLFATAGVHQRLYTVTSRGLIRFGTTSAFLERRPTPAEGPSPDARRDRVGYFLDPWGTPYWIYYDPKADVVFVYSMGPNRKRDTLVTDLSPAALRAAAMDGDDIGVAVVLVPEPVTTR